MKILLINGSPRRNGNTSTALTAIEKGITANLKAEVESIRAYDLKVAACLNCDFCKRHAGKCVHPDDTNFFLDKVIAADVIIFASPVYWWGISAQTKLLIDKFYARDEELHKLKKQVGIVSTGAGELDDPQYQLIGGQMRNICKFLGWNLIFSESIMAWGGSELLKNQERLNELEYLWNSIDSVPQDKEFFMEGKR